MTYEIGGARGTVDDPEVALKKSRAWGDGVAREVLLADASIVFGRDHLESAVRHAVRAQQGKRMAARTVPIEALRYLSARRQVSDAIRVAGIRRSTKEMAVVVFGGGGIADLLAMLGWTRDDRVLEPGGKSLEVLGITTADRQTVPTDRMTDLALERLALLDVEQ